MAIPGPLRSTSVELLDDYCANRFPEHLRDQVRLSYSIRGNAISILEHRPPWPGSSTDDWSDLKIAKLQWDPPTATWSFYRADSHGRWLHLDDLPPVGDLVIALRTIDQNPHGCFWG